MLSAKPVQASQSQYPPIESSSSGSNAENACPEVQLAHVWFLAPLDLLELRSLLAGCLSLPICALGDDVNHFEVSEDRTDKIVKGSSAKVCTAGASRLGVRGAHSPTSSIYAPHGSFGKAWIAQTKRPRRPYPRRAAVWTCRQDAVTVRKRCSSPIDSYQADSSKPLQGTRPDSAG
jgi:hypothetical protein